MKIQSKEKLKKAYKFRLYPTKDQEERLLWALDKCRIVYNLMLDQLKKQDKPNVYILQNLLPKLKEQIPELKDVYSKTLQYEVHRLFSNLKSCKNKNSLKYLDEGCLTALHYNQSGYKIISRSSRLNMLHLSKIGDIPIRVHRLIEGKIKQVIIKKYPSDKWFVSIIVEQEHIIIQKQQIKNYIGIDVGIKHFLTDSEGRRIENSHYLEKNLKKLRRKQRRLHKMMKDSRNMKKMKIKIAKLHEKIANQRDDFVHKLSRYYVNKYEIITLEDLDIRAMIHDSYISRSISDVAWFRFSYMLSYKSQEAGKKLIKVDPRNTSKIYKYGRLDRDYNASLNILEKGLKQVGTGQTEFTPVDIRPLQKLHIVSASQVVESGSFLQNK